MIQSVCPLRLPASLLDEAARVLKEGGVVAFPTETYYGLAVDPFNEKAVERLFQVKGRSSIKPILTIISNEEELPMLADRIPAMYSPLISSMWPGPLTLIFPALSSLPRLLTGGTGTVGIRISSHPHASQLLQFHGAPLTATSANISGQNPGTSAAEVSSQLRGRIDFILDGGETPGGKGSTIVAVEDGRLRVLREGVIASEELTRKKA